MEKNSKTIEEVSKTLTSKVITIIGLICIIGLIVYLVFVYGIVIPTVYDNFLG